jgi:hypothetical protein
MGKAATAKVYGQEFTTPDGYVRVKLPDHPSASKSGSVAKHRLVMEEKLGRPLLPEETIHHLNGIRSDNRPENLELWVSPQKPGQRAEDLVAWAYDALTLYGPEQSIEDLVGFARKILDLYGEMT